MNTSQKLNKQQLKAFRLIAGQLPTISDQTCEKHWMLGSEIIALQLHNEIEGEVINPEKRYLYVFPVLLAANHYRRLKKAFYRADRDGVQEYIMLIERIAEEFKTKTDNA